ncbi:MAG: NAD(P)/FAD-dependent oxidoreductase [Candidatus Aenigmatarchaeota archaeon]
MKDFDVVIIGGGPAGCRTGEKIAKKGYEVLILEEHPKIGEPVQCTGLVSKKIGKIPKKLISNRIKRARFFCGKEYFEVESKEDMLVIDRKGYDAWLAERAEDAGCKIMTSSRFLDFKNSFVITNKSKFKTKLLIGADGPNSSVAKVNGIKLPEKILLALQVKVESSFDENTVELHFGKGIAPGSFAWVVPEDEKTARVGLMCKKDPNEYLEKFLNLRFGEVEYYEKVGDIVRYGLIKESVSDKVLLVGDAASQVKPFSAGGLVYNKICAEIASKAVIKALKEENFSKSFLIENYDKIWKKELSLSIREGMLMKTIFEKISDFPLTFKLIRELKLENLARFLDVDFLLK